MMEFTLSRVCLTVCGIVLLAAVIGPMMYLHDSSVDDRMQTVSENAAELIDRFARSEADVMTLSMMEILPDVSCSMTFDGHLLTLEKEESRYFAALANNVNACTLKYNDIIEITKAEKGLEIRVLDQFLK